MDNVVHAGDGRGRECPRFPQLLLEVTVIDLDFRRFHQELLIRQAGRGGVLEKRQAGEDPGPGREIDEWVG